MLRIHFTALLACAVVLVATAAFAEDTSAQKEVRARRLALLKAVNARDAKAVASFFAPGYVSKAKSGKTSSREEVIAALEHAFKSAPQLKEELKIEKIEVAGDTATVTNAETDTFTGPDGKTKRVTERYRQTWKKVKGTWLLAAEEQL
jgi:uncharacterized protein (TIGR02246 family)